MLDQRMTLIYVQTDVAPSVRILDWTKLGAPGMVAGRMAVFEREIQRSAHRRHVHQLVDLEFTAREGRGVRRATLNAGDGGVEREFVNVKGCVP